MTMEMRKETKLYDEYVKKVGKVTAFVAGCCIDPVVKGLTDAINELSGTVALHEENEGPLLLVVTNENMTNGAAQIFNTHIQDYLAKRFGGDFYIFPSSIHEVITAGVGQLGVDGDEVDFCKSMIQEINRTVVDPNDVLSDHLYYYNSEEKRIKEVR